MCRQLPFPRLWQIWGRGEKRLWRIFNSFFSCSLYPAAALSHPSRKWKGALTAAVSSSAQCALQKGQTPLLGNLGTRRRRVNVGVLQEKACSEWGGWRAAFARGLLRGCFPLLECSREGSRVTKSCLWLSRWVVGGTSLEMATEAGSKPIVKGTVFSVSESCCVPLLLDSGVEWLVLFLPCPVCFGRAPGRNKTAGVEADGSISVYKWRGTCVHSYLPPCKGRLLTQWGPNRLHLFCLSLKHSFLVLTGNNLAGISNWNELFNFYIDNLSSSQAGDLPCALQIGRTKSRYFYKFLLRPNLFF